MNRSPNHRQRYQWYCFTNFRNCSLKSEYIITLWHFCSTHIVSYIKSNCCGQSWIRRHDLHILCRIFRSTIIKFLNLSFRIPRIYFRIEYVLLVFVNFWYLKFYFIFLFPYCSILFQFFYIFMTFYCSYRWYSFLYLWANFWNFYWNLLLSLFFVPYSLYCFSFTPFSS